MNDVGETGAPRRSMFKTALVVLPLALFVALAALFMIRLGAGDPSKLPSALIGRAAPQTILPPLNVLFKFLH